MNLTLKRSAYRADGIFSTLYDENGHQVAVTLEHAYDDGNGGWAPKLPLGVFLCVRGQHQLLNMAQPFTTFEITGVVGHTNILFHCGNFDRDSEGCCLVGDADSFQGTTEIITGSRDAFARLLQLEDGIDTFNLTVIE